MKILLDEGVPWPMHKLLSGHTCSAVQDIGWGGIKNSELLQRAEGEFDLFIAILELSTNDIGRIQAASSLIQDAIEQIQSNEFKQLSIP